MLRAHTRAWPAVVEGLAPGEQVRSRTYLAGDYRAARPRRQRAIRAYENARSEGRDTDQATLQAGVAELLNQITATTAVQAIVFATNSARTLPTIPAIPGLHIDYLASARKPLSIAAYRDLPKPGMVIGDQTATDGVLAWRLGYAFLHYCPNLPDIPTGPRLMRYLGRPIHALLFHSS